MPAVVLCLVLGGVGAAIRNALPRSAQPPAESARCPALDPRGPAPDPDLYCIELVHAPDFPGVSGFVALTPPTSPFGASVTAAGSHRFDLTLHAAGLPDPAGLGDYTGYVAWATTPLLRPVVNLGPVANGRTPLGAVDLDKFLVLVTAEAAPGGASWDGRIVLRGISAGMRMEPEDLLAVTGMVGGGAPGPAPRGWTRPPMHPSVAMMPGVGRLAPPVDPFLPAAAGEPPPDLSSAASSARRGSSLPATAGEALPDLGQSETSREQAGRPGPPGGLPDARPRELVRLGDGGTLDLEAGLVHRTIGGRAFTMYGYNGQYPRPPRPRAAGGHDHGERHQPARVPDRRALARHPPREPVRRRPRPHPGPHRAGRDLPVPDSLSRRRSLLVPPAPPRGLPAGPRALRQPARRRGRPRLLRPREPRAGADARRPAGGRRRPRAVRARGGRPTR